MLKLKRIDKEVKESVEFDVYVPLKIRLEYKKNPNDYNNYWRTGDFERSLIEIGLGSETGILRSFTLTVSNNNKSSKSNFYKSDCKIIKGIPVFFIDDFPPSGIMDFKKLFNVILQKHEILILMDTNECVKKIINGRVEFWFDLDNNLIAIKALNVTDSEMNIFKQGLQS